MAYETRDECINGIALAKKAKHADEYIQSIYPRLKDDFFKCFVDCDDYNEIMLLKSKLLALSDIQEMILSDINSGKVAERMLENIEKEVKV